MSLIEHESGSSIKPIPDTIKRILRSHCGCHTCEPFLIIRASRAEVDFSDLITPDQEMMKQHMAEAAAQFEALCREKQYKPRVMDLPEINDLGELMKHLAYDGFYPGCQQYRDVVLATADGSYESEVALSRVKTFERNEAARSAPRRRSKGASKPAPKPRRSEGRLFEPSDFLPTREELEAEYRRRKFMDGPEKVNKSNFDFINSIVRATNSDNSQ